MGVASMVIKKYPIKMHVLFSKRIKSVNRGLQRLARNKMDIITNIDSIIFPMGPGSVSLIMDSLQINYKAAHEGPVLNNTKNKTENT